MGATLSLTIPESTTTRFLVATDRGGAPGMQRLRDMLPAGGLARTARDLLASPLLVVTGSGAVGSPWSSRLLRMGGGEAEVRALRSARRHLVVTAIATPAAQPRHAQAARLVARALAAATGGGVADLDAEQILADPADAEPERFTLSQDWLGVLLSPGSGQTVRACTHGLHRFGLPELLVCDVPYRRLTTATSVLRGLAVRLLTDLRTWLATAPATSPWHLNPELRLDPHDILRYWGLDDTGPPGTAHADPAGLADPAGDTARGSRRRGRAGQAGDPARAALGDLLLLSLSRYPSDCPGCRSGLLVSPPGGQGAEWWDRTAVPAVPARPASPRRA